MTDLLPILVFVIALVAIMFWIRETYQDKRELDALRDALRVPSPIDAESVGVTPMGNDPVAARPVFVPLPTPIAVNFGTRPAFVPATPLDFGSA